METIREDVAKLIEEAKPKPVVKNTIYRVRKDWDKPNTQIGAYSVLDNAIAACDKAGAEYKVYDENGIVVYQPKVENKIDADTPIIVIPAVDPKNIKVGDIIELKDTAKWTNGKNVPNWVKNSTLYVRKIKANGEIGISIFKTGLITGYIEKS
jgi:hypothetical protein